MIRQRSAPQFSELLESISAQLDRIQCTANAVAELDVLAALAQVAAENNYCRSRVSNWARMPLVLSRMARSSSTSAW